MLIIGLNIDKLIDKMAKKPKKTRITFTKSQKYPSSCLP